MILKKILFIFIRIKLKFIYFLKKSYYIAFFLLFFAFLFNHTVNSQDKWWKDKKYKTETIKVKYAKCKKTFVEIGDAFNYSNVYSLIPFFESEVYLNIRGEDKGYNSSDQAKNILENFLTNYPVSGFKWRNSSRSDLYAFATGKFKYKKNGYVNEFDISVSLNYIDESWLIDQIIIN